MLAKVKNCEISLQEADIIKTDITATDSLVSLSYLPKRDAASILLRGECEGVLVDGVDFKKSDPHEDTKPYSLILSSEDSEISVNFSK